VIATTFWGTQKILDYFEGRAEQADAQAVPHRSQRPTQLNELPRFRPEVHNFISWLELVGLNVEELPGKSVVRGQPVLDLLAVPPATYHRVGVQFSYLSRYGVRRVTVWIKGTGAFALEAGDGKSNKVGTAVYDLANAAVHGVHGDSQNVSIIQGPAGWRIASFDMQTSDATLSVFLRLLGPNATWEFNTDPPVQLTLGGIEVDPDN